jgi:hypothetical protein
MIPSKSLVQNRDRCHHSTYLSKYSSKGIEHRTDEQTIAHRVHSLLDSIPEELHLLAAETEIC